jgi:hypothetical protein
VPEDPEEYLRGMIRGEIPYVQKEAGEDAGYQEEDVSSFLNLPGDRMEIEMFDKGQTNNDDEVANKHR